ncbi:MAG: hypothetical protein R3282_03810, partial [Rhodothermales bacterium]|nr:hypothetical protein [Rhodothermales bacterium]
VTQGDVVELRWTTDEKLTLHMHGYDIELAVTPGERAVMRVDTTKTGRFPVLNHDANPPYVLLYMDVTAK